ncbi:restriction endonuclease [Halobacillus litoralis]|uniref:Restriction endonuclease n=1 Tax=Halobacillus litoralis TaxID=45668 RepID=A0A845DVW6_9BACI|nr:restriction endonuclease [Halobacillus litoralis]MYL21650.1 restriction endonuclease [Halobacillus litoralis]
MSDMHLVLKFPNESLVVGGKSTDTIKEHKEKYEAKNRLIWGQGSQKQSSGLAKPNRDRIKDQVSKDINTYTFFLANNKGNRELFVGKMIGVYDIGEIPKGSPLVQYIPSYYASDVGTSDDINNLFVDVTTFFKIDSKYLDNITLESNGKKIMSIKNPSSIFKVNLDDELKKLLEELLANPDTNFQYQVEQEEVDEDVAVVDKPKGKPAKGSGRSSSTFKRDSKTSKTAIVTAKFKCELDGTHKDFISRVTGKNYVEAHHLIPMEYQEDFRNSIDVEANIVSLCVGCHKKLHHASSSYIKPIIEDLYDDRISRLNDCGIKITKVELMDFYI